MSAADWSPDVARLAVHDEDEWARVERTFAGRLLAYVARRVHDPEARDDIVQEVFLGAIRGIQSFDERFTFEQYLFGICRNRTIDHLRRRQAIRTEGDDDDASSLRLDDIARVEETPSRIVRESDLADRGRDLLARALRDWVDDTWASGEFTRLMVIEALFRGGWRNRDTWARFGLRDETAVAGIKFRALRKLRDIVERYDESNEVAQGLAALTEDGDVPLDVATVWSESRVSCPSRHWLARWLAGTLDPEPAAFIELHVDEIGCPWCSANRDDLARSDDAELEPLLECVQMSTSRVLRSGIQQRRDP
ncbi:MAG: sigma-70 family RNA polymerase sigma factor [Planctomycetota bacterium]